ncbi:MAG: SOS response-associated peptidase family protein, partial [Blautia wexlerae]
TTANNSMKKIHDRMPLILEREQITDWFDNNKMPVLLRQTPTLLNRQTEYEQQSLFS